MDGSFITFIGMLILAVIFLNHNREISELREANKNINEEVKLKYICKLAEKYDQPLTIEYHDSESSYEIVTSTGFPQYDGSIYLYDYNISLSTYPRLNLDDAKIIPNFEKIFIGSDPYENILYEDYNTYSSADFYIDVLTTFEEAKADIDQNAD